MSDIPTEMFLEILRRVPVEDLFRFRSVCKAWRRIIDDPNFTKQHIHRGVGQDWFFHLDKEEGTIFLLPFIQLFCRNYMIKRADAITVKNSVSNGVPFLRLFPVPSCNGLILISTRKGDLVWRIWNPFTGESLEFNNCVNVNHGERTNEFRRIQRPYSGIGYDEINDDYKVVRIVGFSTYVYSVNSNDWRRIEDLPAPYPVCERGRIGVFAYGALHWFACQSLISKVPGWVVSLNLSTEKYRTIGLPPEIIPDFSPYLYTLYALSDCLFFTCPQISRHFVVWMCKDYGSENVTWVKIISLEWVKMIMISLEVNSIFRPIAYLKNKQRILLSYDDEVFVWYDLMKDCVEILSIECDITSYDSDGDSLFYSQVFSCKPCST